MLLPLTGGEDNHDETYDMHIWSFMQLHIMLLLFTYMYIYIERDA